MKNALCFFLLLTIKTATLYAQLIPAGRYQIQVAGKKTEKGSRYAEFQTDGSYRLEWNGRDTLPGQTLTQGTATRFKLKDPDKKRPSGKNKKFLQQWERIHRVDLEKIPYRIYTGKELFAFLILQTDSLEGDYVLTEINMPDIKQKVPYSKSLLQIQHHHLSLTVGCNRIAAEIKTGNKPCLGPLLMTEMYCEEYDQLEKAVVHCLEHCTSMVSTTESIQFLEENKIIMIWLRKKNQDD